MAHLRWPGAVLVACLVGGGCLDRARINDRCQWQPPAADAGLAEVLPDLIDEVQLAEELGIRHGDAVRGQKSLEEAHRSREACTNALLADIARRRDVTVDNVASARGRRHMGLEFATVFLPMAAVFALTAGWAAGRIYRRFPPSVEPRQALILVVVMSIVIAGVGFMIGDMWSWQVDAWRLGNDHLSYRAFYRPWVQHPTAVVLATVALCAAVAASVRRAAR